MTHNSLLWAMNAGTQPSDPHLVAAAVQFLRVSRSVLVDPDAPKCRCLTSRVILMVDCSWWDDDGTLTMLTKAGLLIKLAMSNPSPAAICGMYKQE